LLGLSITRNEVRVPSSVVWLVVPALATFVACVAYSVILSIILGPSSDFNILEFLPRPVAIGVAVWGVYAGFCAVVLWVAMWTYWGAKETSHKAAWFLVLLFGLPLGAIGYALYLWKRGNLKVVHADLEIQNDVLKFVTDRKRITQLLIRTLILSAIGLALWVKPSSFPLWSFARVATGAILGLEAALVIAFQRRNKRAYISLTVLALVWIAILW
jgi:hypothetical protein